MERRDVSPCPARRLARAATVLPLLNLILSGCAANADSAATAEAAAVVTRLQAGLLRIDRELAGRPLAARVAALSPLLQDTHDFNYMGRLALGPQWQRLSAADQERYLSLFRQVAEHDYANRFRNSAGARFTVTQVAAVGANRVQVDTHLEAPAEAPVALRYLLHETPAGWRIVNILAEGVSDLALRRSQYQQILRSSGFDALVAHLQSRLSAIATER